MKKIIALMLFLTFFAHANDSEPGSQYLKAAEAGDRRAQYFLADSWFSSGDLSKAEYWAQKAADSGDADACALLAQIDRQTLVDDIARGLRTLEEIIGQPVTCSAAAGWRADQQVIEAKEAFHLRYNSDCRGAMPFHPLLESGNPGTAQIPVTLPTWDEVIGRDVKAEDFNGWLLNRILRDKGTPVYTIHAEVEGCAYQHNFVDLLKRAAQEGVTFCPLSELLSGTLPLGQVVRGNIAGREGWLGCQQIAGSR